MQRQIINIQQNTPEWEEWRKHSFGASDCAAMLGISPYKTRAQLLREKLGFECAEPSSRLQEIFAAGHQAEKAILPHLEERLAQVIMPCVMSTAGGIAASLDGISFDGQIIIEHKLLRESQASQKRFVLAQVGQLQEHDMAQVQQQLLVSGAAKAWFVVSDGTPERLAMTEVLPCPTWQKRILEGWARFKEVLTQSTDSAFERLALKYIANEQKIKALQDAQNQLRAQMIVQAEEKATTVLIGGGLTLKQITRKGAIDYSQIPELKAMDLEQYRKPESVSWRINIGV